MLSLPDDVLLLTGLSGILFPCESIMRPLLLRIRDDCVLCCSVCCLIVVIDCVVAFDDTHKPDKSILEPRDSRSRRILSLSIWTWKGRKGNCLENLLAIHQSRTIRRQEQTLIISCRFREASLDCRLQEAQTTFHFPSAAVNGKVFPFSRIHVRKKAAFDSQEEATKSTASAVTCLLSRRTKCPRSTPLGLHSTCSDFLIELRFRSSSTACNSKWYLLQIRPSNYFIYSLPL